MADKIVMLVVLIFVVGIIYGSIRLIMMNPNMIAGFKMSDDPAQREKDEAWVKLNIKYMHIANIVTIIGGLAGIVGGWITVYILSLVLPSLVAAICAQIAKK